MIWFLYIIANSISKSDQAYVTDLAFLIFLFSCSICSARFKYKKSLTKHIKVVHKGIKEKNYRKKSARQADESHDDDDDFNDSSSDYTYEPPDHETEVDVATSMISQSNPRLSSSKIAKPQSGNLPQTVSLQSIQYMIRTVKEARQRTVSKKPRPFVCKICGRNFTENRYLTQHERLHTKEKPYQCDFCPEKFRTFGTYTLHRMDHTGERPFKCKYCKWSFKSRGALTDHERKHTGERPYKCKFCDKAFTRSTHLRSHYVTHSTEQLFSCTICRVKFKYLKTLKRHMRIKHKSELQVVTSLEVLPLQGKRNPLPPGAGEIIQWMCLLG